MMEFKFEELDLDGAYQELSEQIQESFGVTDFLTEKRKQFEYDSPERKMLNDWFDENHAKLKKLMSVRKALRIIRYWEYEKDLSA